MRINAGDVESMLDLDLEANGWDCSLETYPSQDVRQFAMLSLKRSLLKKFVASSEGTTPEGDALALSRFLESNEKCRTFPFEVHPMWEIEAEAIGEAKTFLNDFFYPKWRNTISLTEDLIPFVSLAEPEFILHEKAIYSHAALGPGASIGAKATDFYTKLATSKLTFTDQSLLQLYRLSIRHHPTWADAEICRSKEMGERIVSGNRLSFVPKTSEISRCICTEPILNMFFQKGIQGVLEKRLLEVVGIDFSNQPDENAELARIGSLTGRFGTLDLSSASDSLSLSTVKEFFPRRVFDVLSRTRSRFVTLPGGQKEELHMISSMGNAFTFPLQTIFFTALVLSAYKVLGIKPIHFRGKTSGTSNFAVFGDDIIVETKAYGLVSRLLHLTGFTVNEDKSYNTGLFRESCGHDYYHGHDVRGVYIKRLNDANDCYSAINRLNRWSARHGIFLVNLVSYLSHRCRFLPIPYDEDDSAGIKVPLCLVENRTFHKDTGGLLYRYSKISPNLVKLPPKSRAIIKQIGFFENPSGLLLAFIAGYIRDGSVGYRITRRRANIRKRWTSRWEFVPSARLERAGFSEDWKVFTAANLGKI